jgi:formate hydrogenlyase subunit 3/multisubunit Na+/H+ antiporter MnhD subunit
MSGCLAALAVYAVTGVIAAACGRDARSAGLVGAFGCLAAAVLGLPEVVGVLAGGPGFDRIIPWDTIPGAAAHFGLDGLSAVLLVPMFVLTALVAVACVGYFADHPGSLAPGTAWLMLNLTATGMLVVALARNAVLFLLGWEVMAVAGFFLVIYHAERPETRPAGWKWLIASQLGAACLVPVFVLLGRANGSLEFDRFSVAGMTPGLIGLVFVLAVVGFGTKAGLIPFHVWLPEAHPVAPSPVSALLSGVLIKFGIYGLVRVLIYLGPPPVWWAWVLIGLGLVSGVWGIMNAVVQKDLKRLLAYSSVENVGIITLGLGLGLYGKVTGSPGLAVLGFGGALVHVWTHAAGKGLLFMAAGAVKHAAGTTDIDRLGGLLKAAPVLGTCAVLGAASICGLPPLAGFSGEFLIYLAAFEEEVGGPGLAAIPPLAVLTGLALIGGLAVYTFSKAIGLTFLGAPRDSSVTLGHVPTGMTAPVVILAAACVVLGLAGPAVVRGFGPALVTVSGFGPERVAVAMREPAGSLTAVTAVSVVFLVLVGGLTLLRARMLSGRPVGTAGTWDCGYAAPSARMQYTGSSFAQPLADLVGPAVGHGRERPAAFPYFPGPNDGIKTTADDVPETKGYRPLFRLFAAAMGRGRVLQSGRVHLYVLYIMLTLVAVLIWYAGVRQ